MVRCPPWPGWKEGAPGAGPEQWRGLMVGAMPGLLLLLALPRCEIRGCPGLPFAGAQGVWLRGAFPSQDIPSARFQHSLGSCQPQKSQGKAPGTC